VRERPTDAVMNWRSRQSQANSSPSTGTNKNLTAAEEGWRATIAMGRQRLRRSVQVRRWPEELKIGGVEGRRGKRNTRKRERWTEES
jgi:hypothetical protein